MPATLLYGCAITAFVTLGLSASALSSSFEKIQFAMSSNAAHRQTLANIERQSAETKAKFEAYAQTGDGVVLRDYKCNPTVAPAFDARPWARAHNLPVYSGDNYTVGYVDPSGQYNHYGYCSL